MDRHSEGEHASGLAELRGSVLAAVDDGFFLFNGHVLEFNGIEDLTALLTLDELGIFLASDDFDDGVLTEWRHVVSG